MTDNPFVKNLLADAIINSIPLADYISRFAKRGNRQSSRGSVLFHSPFRDDRNASLSVSLDNNLYNDFAENQGGNIITFCARYNNISRIEAMFMLAEEAGLNIEDFGYNKSDAQTSYKNSLTSEQQAIINVNLMAQSFYTYEIFQNKEALNYATNVRHLTIDTIKEFGLGFATAEDLEYRLTRKGIPLDDIRASGLCKYNESNTSYNFFSNRLIVPTFDRFGNLVGFGGRALDNNTTPKYKNTEANAVFDKKSIMFNEYKASSEMRTTDSVIIMEGYLDVISAWQHGIKYAVASMGTAFNETMYDRLSGKVKTVYVCFDSDPAGISASIKAFKLALKANRSNLRAIIIPKNIAKDADEFLFKQGVDEFKKLIDSSVNYLEFILLTTELNLDNRTSVNDFKNEYYSIMLDMKLSLIDQYYYLEKLADFIQIPFGIVEADYRESHNLSSHKSFTQLASIKKKDLVDSATNDLNNNPSSPTININSDPNTTKKDDISKLSPYKIKDKNESYFKSILNDRLLNQLESIIEFKLRNPFISFSNILFTHFNLGDKLKPQKLYFSHDFKTLNVKHNIKFNRDYIDSLYGPERYGIPIADGKSILQLQDLNVIQYKDGTSISKDNVDLLLQNFVTGGFKYLSYDIPTVTNAISNILMHKEYGDMSRLFDDDIYTLSEDASTFLLNSFNGVDISLKPVAVDILTGYILQLCKDTDVSSYATRISNNLIDFFNDSHAISITDSLDKLFTLVDYRFKQISNQCEFLYREQLNCQYQNEVQR